MVRLSSEQDGLGYLYGSYVTASGAHVRIDVLPPKTEPKPYFVTEMPAAQHDMLWIVYADGEEIARLKHRDDLATLDIDTLLPLS